MSPTCIRRRRAAAAAAMLTATAVASLAPAPAFAQAAAALTLPAAAAPLPPTTADRNRRVANSPAAIDDTSICVDGQAACAPQAAAPLHATPSRHRIGGQFTAGLAVDSDAVNSVSRIFDNPSTTRPGGSGLAFTGGARLNGQAAAGTGWLYGSAALTTRNAVSGPKSNYQLGELRGGYAGRSGRDSYAIGGVLRHGRFADAPLLTQFGGQADFGFAPGRLGRFGVRVEAVREDYARTSPRLSRDGWHFDVASTLRIKTGSTTAAIIGVAVERKTAVTVTEGYGGARLLGNVRVPIAAGGAYVGLTSSVRYLDFDDTPLRRGRRELRLFNRAAIGVPLRADGPILEAAVSHTLLDYDRASQLRRYSSVGGEVRLIWNFRRLFPAAGDHN